MGRETPVGHRVQLQSKWGSSRAGGTVEAHMVLPFWGLVFRKELPFWVPGERPVVGSAVRGQGWPENSWLLCLIRQSWRRLPFGG